MNILSYPKNRYQLLPMGKDAIVYLQLDTASPSYWSDATNLYKIKDLLNFLYSMSPLLSLTDNHIGDLSATRPLISPIMKEGFNKH